MDDQNKEKDAKKFRVVDKRGKSEEETSRESTEEGVSVSENNPEKEAQVYKMDDYTGQKSGQSEPGSEELSSLPPMTFANFLLSLATNVNIHLGTIPNPMTGDISKNIPLAQQTIDLFSVLEEKTKNNLTKEEEKLLSTLLFDLRMKFVENSKEKDS